MTLPKVDYTPETGSTVVDNNFRSKIPIKQIAISSTVALFEDNLLVVDPISDEEELACSTITIVFNELDQICFIHKSGGAPMPRELLPKVFSKVRGHSELIRKLILTTVK